MRHVSAGDYINFTIANSATQAASLGSFAVGYLVTEGWYLDDFGDLAKEERGDAPGAPINTHTSTMPQDVRDAQNINPADIPF